MYFERHGNFESIKEISVEKIMGDVSKSVHLTEDETRYLAFATLVE